MANTLAQYVGLNSDFTLTNFVSGSVSLNGISVQKVSIRLNSSIFDNKKEDGSSIVDSRILLPITIEVQIFCSTLSAVEKINDILMDINSIYKITTKGITFDNLMLKNNDILQSDAMMSASPIKLSFMQRILQNNNNPTCKQSGDSTIIDYGISTVKSAATSVQTFATNLINNYF